MPEYTPRTIFEDRGKRDNKSDAPPPGETETILDCILTVMFDLFFYVDSKLRVLSDSIKLRHFLSIPTGHAALGRPLEAYVPASGDKSRLKFLIERAKHFQGQAGSVQAPPVVRMSMLIEGSPKDIDILILPVHVDSRGGSIPQSGKFLVCINVAPQVDIRDHPPASLQSIGHVRHKPIATRSRKLSQCHIRDEFFNVGRLNELVAGVNSEGSHASDIQRTTRAPRHLLLIQSLSRDLHMSIPNIADLGSLNGFDWINPSIKVHDRLVLQDELVRTLPADAQHLFVDALAQADCKRASSILARSLEGNLDIFNHQTLGATVRSSQLISATFRLFLAIATSSDKPSAAIETLHGLAQWAFRIHTKYTITKGVLINTHLALALGSAALKFPSRFSSDTTKAWITGTFASCFSCHQAFKCERDETSPLLYWVCLLWAGVLRSFGETSDSFSVLENLRSDIFEYLRRHPKCHSVGLLRSLCLNNLSFRQKDENDNSGPKPIQQK